MTKWSHIVLPAVTAYLWLMVPYVEAQGIAQKAYERCEEKLEKTGLLDDCDQDSEDWFPVCVCAVRGLPELYSCCFEEEISSLGQDPKDAPQLLGCPDRDGESYTMPECPTDPVPGTGVLISVPSSFMVSTDSSTFSTSIATTSPPSSTDRTSTDPTSTPSSPTSTSEGGSGSDANGALDDGQSDSGREMSNTRTIGLGVGLGLGIPLILVSASYLSFLIWRHRREEKKRQTDTSDQQDPPQHQSPTMSSVPDRWHSPSTFSTPSEYSNKRLSEMMGSSPSERESVYGRHELGSDMAPISELAAEEWKTEGRGSSGAH